MTAKEFLSQTYRIDQRINSKLEQVQSLHDLATKAGNVLSHTAFAGTRNVHRMEDIIANMVDLEGEIKSDISRLVEIKRDLMTVIEQVAAVEHRTLLELRYICCKTWEEIAANMNYSVRNIHNIHSAALKDVGKILKKKTA